MVSPFKSSLKILHRFHARALELADPAIVNVLEWHNIDKVQFLAPAPIRGHQVGRFEKAQVLRYRLPRHVKVLAQLSQRPSVLCIEQVQEPSPTGVGKSLEYEV
jgi:hypothetical protein